MARSKAAEIRKNERLAAKLEKQAKENAELAKSKKKVDAARKKLTSSKR